MVVTKDSLPYFRAAMARVNTLSHASGELMNNSTAHMVLSCWVA